MAISERLRYARQHAGLKGPRVTEMTGIGGSSLSEFENGKREPSLSQLQKLASAYRRSVSFFLAEGAIPPEVVLWREKAEAEGGDVEARFLRLCEQYHNLEVWTNEESPDYLPVAVGHADTYGYRDAETLAKQVRRMLDLGDRPGLCLLPVLQEVCGVKVFHLGFEPSGTAASTKSDTFGAAILLNARNKRWRRNFDLAHELFHLLTWNLFRQPRPAEMTSSSAGPIEEKWATCFASNLLMPWEAVRQAVNAKAKTGKVTFEELFDIARQFDVSVEALLWRIHNGRLLPGDAETTKSLIERAGALAPILEEREDSNPSMWPDRYKALAIKALRHGAISIGRFAEYLNISRQDAMRYVEQEIMDDESVPLAPA